MYIMFHYHPNDNFITYCKHLANHPLHIRGIPELNVKLIQGDRNHHEKN